MIGGQQQQDHADDDTNSIGAIHQQCHSKIDTQSADEGQQPDLKVIAGAEESGAELKCPENDQQRQEQKASNNHQRIEPNNNATATSKKIIFDRRIRLSSFQKLA